MAITSTIVSNTAPSIYTSDGSNAVTTMYFCNTSKKVLHLTVHLVPKNAVASHTNIIYYQVPIAIKDTYVVDTEKLVLEDGDKICANIEIDYDGTNVIVASVSTIGI